MIKRGKERASVEVELKKASGKNVVIRREWKRESNVSNFTLNGELSVYSCLSLLQTDVDDAGERANTKEVEECVKKFHIQVDNLWLVHVESDWNEQP
jgi:phosphoribosylformimino-5-aminoimidazole carboxamide ribonucleotide (ProFAR) isomerase